MIDSEDEVEFPEYRWTGMTGTVYHPRFAAGKWFLINEMDFNDIALLCGIPADDAVLLKLKYGR